MTKIVRVFLVVALISGAGRPRVAAASLISNIDLNEGIHADNDFPPGGASTQNSVSDSIVPFQKTISANDGTGASVTGTFGLTDSGQVASFTASASGVLTANGNDFGIGTLPASTSFQLLQPVSYTAQINCEGSPGVGSGIRASLIVYYGSGVHDYLDADGLDPTNSTSGYFQPGLITIQEDWGIGYNDAPRYPASESGTYSLTFTLTAIPEPSSMMLIAMPAAFALRRRRRIRNGDTAHY